MKSPLALLQQLPAIAQFGVVILLVSLVAWLAGAAIERLLGSYGQRAEGPPAVVVLMRRIVTPVSLLLPAIALYLLLPWDLLQVDDTGPRALMKIGIIMLGTWLAARALLALEEIITPRLGVDRADNLRARTLQTQLRVLRRIAVFVVLTFGIIAVLLSIDGFRDFGTGLLASAGVASVVIGFAAQRTLSNLLAGFQVGFTQPIRLDDVVVVEGEWGRIEEITLTYVVVAIWDQRRLVLPISYFLETPFQNWTRKTAQILGTVFLRADFTVDIEALRAELQRLAHQSEHFDGRVCLLQVTDAGERSLELRALVSARDSGSAWDLRCEVREGLIRFLQRTQPEALPKIRAVDGPVGPATYA
ncbi:MAG: mechanosensitive ion channel domain-containing protein [Gammaproteobacteria bacterium]|jgi:small-conductance mechanosensitive channel|nr:mechanosensitive ion channel domain-containing protein [Gammaproteobacteria bacterium]